MNQRRLILSTLLGLYFGLQIVSWYLFRPEAVTFPLDQDTWSLSGEVLVFQADVAPNADPAKTPAATIVLNRPEPNSFRYTARGDALTVELRPGSYVAFLQEPLLCAMEGCYTCAQFLPWGNSFQVLPGEPLALEVDLMALLHTLPTCEPVRLNLFPEIGL